VAFWRERLGPAPPGRRDVVTVHRPLDEPATRELLGWAVATGAAVVRGVPEIDWMTAALWARPTILAATRDELAALAEALAGRSEKSLRSWRGPFARLRLVLDLDALTTTRMIPR
jgi:hypothetical protein